MLQLILLAIAVICALIHISTMRPERTWAKILETFLLYIIVFNIGVNGFIMFYQNTFLAKQMAQELGLESESPFQFEVAGAYLAFGLLGILCIWFRKLFWFATVIGSATFFFGAAYGQVMQMLQRKAPYLNWDNILWGDIIIPFVYTILMFIYLFTDSSETLSDD